ncbi:MAG: ComF family protein [Planctomycetes bacterium]|nr:ComF family protein [Planctomycetota bacterium]
MLRYLTGGLLDLLLPRHCAVSGRPLMEEETGPIAPEVLREVELAGADYCTRCGAPQGAGVGVIRECASCREYRDGFGTREVVAIGKYEGVLKEICLALKFGGERKVAGVLAAWLAQLLFDRGLVDKIDVIVPMPLHVIRRFQRGYNQAEVIARPLAQSLEKPVLSEVLRRAGKTERQATLSPAQRKANVEGVFEVRAGRTSDIDGKSVLLIDDVMTTGATLGAAARCLKKAGARAVYAAVAARASLDAGV